MKRKLLRSVLIVICILCYSISFIATKKVVASDPCYQRTITWLYKDSTRSRHAFIYYPGKDTIIISIDTVYASHAAVICDTICSIYKDSCNRTGVPILVVNSNDTARSTWDNQYGKKILFRICP